MRYALLGLLVVNAVVVTMAMGRDERHRRRGNLVPHVVAIHHRTARWALGTFAVLFVLVTAAFLGTIGAKADPLFIAHVLFGTLTLSGFALLNFFVTGIREPQAHVTLATGAYFMYIGAMVTDIPLIVLRL